MRTLVLLLATLGTVMEALVVAAALYVLGDVIGAYSMSMAGVPAERGQATVWVLGGVLAVLLAAPAGPLVRVAATGRSFGRPARALIITALALQALLGVVVELTAGGVALLGVLAVFSLLLLSLVTDPARRGTDTPVDVATETNAETGAHPAA